MPKRKFSRVRNYFQNLIAAFLLVALITGLSLTALYAHKRYLEYVIGSNTFLIKSLPDAPLQGSATAFEIKARSGRVYTVTNSHVCELGNKDGQLQIFEKQHSKRWLPIKILENYQDHDLCILEGVAEYDGLDIGSRPEVGDQGFVFGHPFGSSLHSASGRIKIIEKISVGTSLSEDRCTGEGKKFIPTWLGPVCVIIYEALSTELLIYPGNSGSALVNIYGNVIGVIFASNNTNHWGYAVPFEHLERLLNAY